MPCRIDVCHDVNGKASHERLVRRAAGIHGKRVKAGADAGIRTKQPNRPEQALGFVDHMQDVFFLRDVAFERRAVERGRDRPRGRDIEIGDDHLGSAGAMKSLAQRAADAVGAAGDDDDLAVHLHR